MSKFKASNGVVLEVKLETITPSKAADWLKKNRSNYRKLIENTVNTYTQDMEAGDWTISGHTISFNDDGTLRDGQHRLTAIIKSGTTQQILVVRGLPKRVGVENDDTGKKRELHDHLRYEGWTYAKQVAPSLSMLHTLGTREGAFSTSGACKASRATLLRLANRNRKEIQVAAEKGKYTDSKGSKFTGSIVTTLYFCFRRVDQTLADDVIATLAGDDENIRDPFYKASQLALNHLSKKSVSTLGRSWQMGVLIKAWNARFEGRELTRLHYDNVKEGVPLIAGFDYSTILD